MNDGKTERLSGFGPEGKAGIARAAEILGGGGTVAFPTETVYGLGANALDSVAVARIFEAKQRPSWDPLIVHVSDREMLERVCVVPPVAEELIAAFWPGPLTLLLPRKGVVPDSVTAGRPLVGVRMPAHPVALELIRLAGVPIAAPSANRFGHTSPTTAQHVLDDLDGRIDAVLDGGATEVGVESTVVGLADTPDWSMEDREFWIHPLVIYRPGAVTLEMLASVAGVGHIVHFKAEMQAVEPQSMPSPGVGIRHYAPKARLVLVDIDIHDKGLIELSLVEAIDGFGDLDAVVGVMLPDGWNASSADRVYRWGAWGNREELARRLFAGLRQLDEGGATVIVCALPAPEGLGLAMRDRLSKAARSD